VDQITVAADGALHLLAEVGGAVEGLFNGFHGEVSVATVHNLEDKFEVPSLSGYLTIATLESIAPLYHFSYCI
jgi:hypothetical protein